MSRFDPNAMVAAKRSHPRLVEVVEAYGGRVVSDRKVHCPNRAAHENDDQNASATIGIGETGDYLIRCHAPSCGLQGSVFDVVMRFEGCDFATAAERVLGRDGPPVKCNGSNRREPKNTNAHPSNLHAARKFADDAYARLIGDLDSLDHLWRTRGVDRATAERFRLGITDDPLGKRYWVFSVVSPSGQFVGAKTHRADGQEKKGFWKPDGVNREQAWPVALEPNGQVWLCPGELKALAVIGAGCAAIGITSGEGGNLPADAIPLLAGRVAVLPYDNDDDGKVWVEKFQSQLSEAGIEHRTIPMGEYVRAPKGDIGDWIVQLIEDGKDPKAIRASLEHAYEFADPLRPYTLSTIWRGPSTWEPAKHVSSGLTKFDDVLDGGLRTRAVHLLVGRTGKAKTQLAMQVAANAALNGCSVGILSLELGRDDVAQLLAAQLGRIPRNHIARGELSEIDARRLEATIRQHEDLPLMIFDDEYWPGGLDRDRLADVVASGCKRFGWRLVILDYLGLLAAVESDRTDYQTDLLNSSAIRRIARQNEVALVVVSALRKSGQMNQRQEDQITLNDVLGAGRLVYDATTVTLVSSEQKAAPTGHPRGTVSLRVLKSRFSPGSLGEAIELTWHPGWGRVENAIDGGGAG